MPASGSSRYASKPAETTTRSGSKRVTNGSTSARKAARYAASSEPAASGTLSTFPGSSRPAGARVERPLVQRGVHERRGRRGTDPRCRFHGGRPSPRSRRGRRARSRARSAPSRRVVEDAEPHRGRAAARDARRTHEREAAALGALERAADGERAASHVVGPATVSPSSHVSRSSARSRIRTPGRGRVRSPRATPAGPRARQNARATPRSAHTAPDARRSDAVGERRMGDQLDCAASSSRRSASRPSCRAADAPAAQSGSRSSSAGSGAVASRVAT